MAVKVDISQFADAVDEILTEFVKEEYGLRQEALAAGADVMIAKLKAASEANAADTGEFASSWEAKKYSDALYVHNTKTVDGGGKKNIPLSNILEYRENGKPFIRQTADAAESEVFNEIKNKLNNGG